MNPMDSGDVMLRNRTLICLKKPLQHNKTKLHLEMVWEN
jgi:hypothetical protein